VRKRLADKAIARTRFRLTPPAHGGKGVNKHALAMTGGLAPE
jgi:hypothetical protein